MGARHTMDMVMDEDFRRIISVQPLTFSLKVGETNERQFAINHN
jgi:hypothetical protein